MTTTEALRVENTPTTPYLRPTKSFLMTKFTLTLITTLGMYCTLQAQSLRGTISDAQGNPLPGASVVADGTNGQFADADGA